MFASRVKPVAFVEHPVTDKGGRSAGPLDVLMDLGSGVGAGAALFPIDAYCAELLQKICMLPGEHLRMFLDHQQELLKDPVSWLTSLDELLAVNADLFENKALWLKVEKTVVVIEFALQDLRNRGKKRLPVFDFEQVRLKLHSICGTEEQLVYLYELKAEYLQSPHAPLDPSEISFDQKIEIEIKKIRELQQALGELKSRRPAKNRLAENYIDNEDFLFMMKISKRTAQTWRDTGVIAFAQVRNKIYYLLADVEALLKSSYIRTLRKR